MKHNFKDLRLPKDSRNEQLETISENHFRPLFDVDRFILKSEVIDNGIDFRIELKQEGNKIGFGLNFQLKSTESIDKNNDGTYSKSLKTSNIEYLLNNGQPAFYGFYIEEEKTMYYENLDVFISQLNSQNADWQDQENHTLRFSKKITPSSINKIYDLALQRGLMLRKLNSKLAENINNIERDNVILIDYNGNVESDGYIENFIEKYGLFLNDECRWKEIINLHNKTSVGSKKSTLYYFIVGLSYVQTGDYFKALDSLKDSFKDIDDLKYNLKGYLIYFYSELQLLYGIIDAAEYKRKISELPEDSDIRNYAILDEIESLIPLLYSSSNFVSEEYEIKIAEFIQNERINKKIISLAKIGFETYKGERLICTIPYYIINEDIDLLILNFTRINNNFRDLILEVNKQKSQFISHYCSLRHNKFLIQFEALCKLKYKSIFDNKLYKDIRDSITKSFNYFLKIGHIQNQIFALSVLLEAYQSERLQKKESEIILQLESYIERYQNPELRKTIDFIKKGGTFVQHLLKTKKKIEEIEIEIETMKAELIELDKKEKKSPSKGSVTINLFPIGYFKIPVNKIETCYEILEIKDFNLKTHMNQLFEIIIPIINVYVLNITEEGNLKGNLEYTGIESYRKMYRVRKAFFENEFCRVNVF